MTRTDDRFPLGRSNHYTTELTSNSNVWDPTWETLLYKVWKVVCHLPESTWWGRTTLCFSEHTWLHTLLTTPSQSTPRGTHQLARIHPSQAWLILQTEEENRRGLIYIKHQTFTQLHLAEVNLAACWDLKITDISTELMASRMWFKVCFYLAFHALLQCLALTGLPAPMFNQTAWLHRVNLFGNVASTPVCDKHLDFTLLECEIRDNLSIVTYLDWWVYIWSESVRKKTKTNPQQNNPQNPKPKQKKPQGKNRP